MPTDKGLSDTPTPELLDELRRLTGAAPKRWSQSRIKLIERVARARSASEAPKPKPEKPKKGEKEGRSIREAALALLCDVVHYERKDQLQGPKNAPKTIPPGNDPADYRTVGLPYDLIIAAIRKEFTGSKTTVACLRWYAVKVRVEEKGYENLRLPQRRPRVAAGTEL